MAGIAILAADGRVIPAGQVFQVTGSAGADYLAVVHPDQIGP